MADHEELLSEMELIERLPTQERLKQAKRRRALQLKKWQDHEKEFIKQQKQQNNYNNTKNGVKFQDHIMLLDAVMRKDFDEAQRLLESGVDPNLSNEDGLTSIHQCCIDDSPDLLRLLIRYGANVNVCDNDLWTPLHAAATCANLEICKILIQNNAELLAVNTDGNMPYDICDDEICLEYIESEMANRGVTQQAIDIKRAENEIRMLEDVKLLNHKFQNINKTFDEQNGATFMHIACANGYTSVLEYLLENKASLNVRDNDGWTPLHVSTFWGHQKAIELLIEYGADIYAKTYNDETVFDLSDDIDVREFIVQKKKEVENNEKSSRTRSLKRTSTGVSRSSSAMYASNSSINSLHSGSSTVNHNSSSVRRSSFRDKEKCRKLDTSFKEVLYANEYQREDLESEEFNDKSTHLDRLQSTDDEKVLNEIAKQTILNQQNLSNNNNNTNDKNNNNINLKSNISNNNYVNVNTTKNTHQLIINGGESLKSNNNNNDTKSSQFNSYGINLINSNNKIPSQITINQDNNKHIYINEINPTINRVNPFEHLNESSDFEIRPARPVYAANISSNYTNSSYNSNITTNNNSNTSNNNNNNNNNNRINNNETIELSNSKKELSISSINNSNSNNNINNSTSIGNNSTTTITTTNNNVPYNTWQNSGSNYNNDTNLIPPFLSDDFKPKTVSSPSSHKDNNTINVQQPKRYELINNNNNNNNNVVNSNNKIFLTSTSSNNDNNNKIPPHVYFVNTGNNDNNNNNYYQSNNQHRYMIHQTDNYKVPNSETKIKFDYNNVIDNDGVKYKFKSDETIGGKSDISSSTAASKFRCSKCLNCSIM